MKAIHRLLLQAATKAAAELAAVLPVEPEEKAERDAGAERQGFRGYAKTSQAREREISQPDRANLLDERGMALASAVATHTAAQQAYKPRARAGAMLGSKEGAIDGEAAPK